MRLFLRTACVALAAGAVALADEPPRANRDRPARDADASGVIGTHQIDRFEAVRQLQASLKADPENLADWVILGELAHEVALDAPSDQDDQYYKMSREAFEKALALDPKNPGLKAAVQFAKDQEADAKQFDQSRRQAARTYLDSRRRELAQAGHNPTVQVYGTPTYAAAPQPAPAQPAPAQPGVAPAPAPAVAPQGYPTAYYRPLYNPQTRQAYTYSQYANGYLPPAAQANPPSTLRQYVQQFPQVLGSQISREFGGTAVQPGSLVNPAARAAPPR